MVYYWASGYFAVKSVSPSTRSTSRLIWSDLPLLLEYLLQDRQLHQWGMHCFFVLFWGFFNLIFACTVFCLFVFFVFVCFLGMCCFIRHLCCLQATRSGLISTSLLIHWESHRNPSLLALYRMTISFLTPCWYSLPPFLPVDALAFHWVEKHN